MRVDREEVQEPHSNIERLREEKRPAEETEKNLPERKKTWKMYVLQT